MGRREISLARLTVLDTTPPELVAVSRATAGLPALGRAKRAHRALSALVGG